MNLENTKLTNEDIEKIQSIIIEKIVDSSTFKETQELNILLDKLGKEMSFTDDELTQSSSKKRRNR